MVIHRNCVSKKILGKIYLPGMFILDYKWNIKKEKFVPKIVDNTGFEIGEYYGTIGRDDMYLSNNHYILKCISNTETQILFDDLTYRNTALSKDFINKYINIPWKCLEHFKNKLIKEEKILIQDIVDYANS